MKSTLFRVGNDRRGTTVVEFALILPVFITLVVGGLYAGIAAFTAESLHFAVEKAARCSSVNTVTCPSSATTISYAQSSYYGPASPAAKFTYSTPACGHTVNGSVSFNFDFGLKTFTVPISASACFP